MALKLFPVVLTSKKAYPAVACCPLVVVFGGKFVTYKFRKQCIFDQRYASFRLKNGFIERTQEEVACLSAASSSFTLSSFSSIAFPFGTQCWRFVHKIAFGVVCLANIQSRNYVFGTEFPLESLLFLRGGGNFPSPSGSLGERVRAGFS